MKNILIPCIALLAFACQSGGNLGLVAKGNVSGEGIVATDGKRALIFAKGTASAGIYQVDETGALRLTKPLGAAHDAVRVIDRDQGLDVTVKLNEPLPAWAEPIVRSLLTAEEIVAIGLTFAAP
jgi:hypothetical protein